MKTTRKNTTLSIAGLAAGLLLVACDLGPTDADLMAPGEQTAREQLATASPTFEVERDGSQVKVAARLNRGSHWVEGDTAIEVTKGHVTVGADVAGGVVLEELELDFADMILGEGIISDEGIHLTDVRARLDMPARATLSKWSPDEQFVYAEVDVDVTVEWSLVVDGEAYPLGPLELRSIPLEMSVNRGAGLELDLAVTSDGMIWEQTGSAELYDLQIVARGHEVTVE